MICKLLLRADSAWSLPMEYVGRHHRNSVARCELGFRFLAPMVFANLIAELLGLEFVGAMGQTEEHHGKTGGSNLSRGRSDR